MLCLNQWKPATKQGKGFIQQPTTDGTRWWKAHRTLSLGVGDMRQRARMSTLAKLFTSLTPSLQERVANISLFAVSLLCGLCRRNTGGGGVWWHPPVALGQHTMITYKLRLMDGLELAANLTSFRVLQPGFTSIIPTRRGLTALESPTTADS